MSNVGTAPRAAVPTSSARAEASRRNGAKSRGPNTAEGKSRSAQNALKHGLRAQKYVVLPEENAAEFRAHAAALIEELAPAGALQAVLAQRVAVASWRLARADRIEAELFEVSRAPHGGGLGLALVRDGNGTRSFETLLRYRGAAMAEFTRALRALKALQAEKAAVIELPPGRRAEARPTAPTSPAQISARPRPDQPAPRRDPSGPGPKAQPNEPEPQPHPTQPEAIGNRPSPRLPAIRTNPMPLGAGAGHAPPAPSDAAVSGVVLSRGCRAARRGCGTAGAAPG
jgi:hypothetical protein